MTTKTKARPVREGVSKAKAPVRRGLAYLIEDAYSKSTVALTVEGIAEKLNDMAIELAELVPKEVMPLQNSITTAFGADVWTSFYETANTQVQQLIQAVQGTQSTINNEFQRLRQGVNGGDMSDMGMDGMAPGGAPGEPGMAPGGAAPAPGEVPPDMAGNDDMALGGNFAGRDKKGAAPPPMESRRIKGRKVNEVGLYSDDLALSPSRPAPVAQEPHTHESDLMPFNIEALSQFEPRAAKLATNIRNMIRNEELSGEQRKGLASVLSRMAASAHDQSQWSGLDAEALLSLFLKDANVSASNDASQRVVAQMRSLAHMLNLKHRNMLESNISMLRKSADPDAIILKVFRTKLKENRDGQMAAIRTARTFAIDIEDVVAVVKEAASRRPQKIVEFKADPDAKKKPWDGAKKPWEGRPRRQRTNEDDMSGDGGTDLKQDVPIFPINQSTTPTAGQGQQPMGAPMSQPTQQMQPNATSAPATGGLSGKSGVAGNSAPNMTGAPTNAPLTPADKRAMQNQNQASQQQNVNTQTGDEQQQRTTPSVGQPPPSAQTGSTALPFQPPGKAMKPGDPAFRQQRQR